MNEQVRALLPRFKTRGMMLVVLAAVMVLAAGVAVWTYVGGTERRNLAAAAEWTGRGEYRRAQLLLEQTARMNPGSVAAARALAEFFDHLGSPSAIEQWQRVVELDPADAPRWRLIESALRHGNLATARQALLDISAPGRLKLEHQRLSAGLALARGERKIAARHLAAMVELEPDNHRFRFNLAAHRVQDGVDLAAARDELEALAREGPLRARATLVLLADAPRRWPSSPDPEATLAARLLDRAPAVSLHPVARPGRSRLVAHLLSPPYPEAGDAAAVALWLRQELGPAEAMAWLARLPEEVRMAPVVIGVVAENALAAGDWTHLEAALRRGAWGPVAPALVGGAFRLRERRERGERDSVGWQVLLEDPERSRPALRLLWRLASAWGWQSEAERTLRIVVRRFPDERWAWESLQELLLRRGDTAGLWRHYASWVKERPADEGARLDRLVLAFLVGRGDAAARSEAAALRRARPGSPVAAAVQALALREEGRLSEAARELPAFAAAATAEPRLALVRGLVLAESGHVAAARSALGLVREPLLPEERDLLAGARALVGEQ